MKPLRDLLKHSSIYMIGQILTRMASVLLLPLYTHCLPPADYGVIAIIDLTCAILGTMICEGMVGAVTRNHFDSEDPRHHDRVWWTGLTFVAVMSTIVLAPLWLGRGLLSSLTLGPDVVDGPWFITLAFLTILIGIPGGIMETYLRVRKWSGLFVAVSMTRLFCNVGLNVWFLVGLDMGVEGLLLGNLSATAFHTCVLSVIFISTRGRYCISSDMARQLFRYSAPLIVTTLAGMAMHEADRYLLRVFRDMEEVGVYALAHRVGFAVHTLCLLPFASIWHVTIYDINKLPDSRAIFGKMYGWFTSGLGILLLGASLTVHPVLPLLTPDAYGESIELVSVILLGFFLFGLSFQFEVPALLSKRTRLLIPGSIIGVTVNIVANVLLIPILGVWGPAWAGVLTYAAYSTGILICCRFVMKIPYPWTRSVLTTTSFIATYVVLRFGLFPQVGPWVQLAASVAVCAFWALLLFGKDGMAWWRTRQIIPAAQEDQPAEQAEVEEPELAGAT
jgi:O-antigen/teichoic acid export membrane protein